MTLSFYQRQKSTVVRYTSLTVVKRPCFGFCNQTSIFCKGLPRQVDVFLSWVQRHNRTQTRLFAFSKVGQRTPPEPLYPEQLCSFPPTKSCRWRENKCLSLRCQCSTNVFELPLIIGQAVSVFFERSLISEATRQAKACPKLNKHLHSL